MAASLLAFRREHHAPEAPVHREATLVAVVKRALATSAKKAEWLPPVGVF